MVKTDENGKELGEFKAGDIFSIENLKFTHPNSLNTTGNCPYVTRASSDNGLTKIIDKAGLTTVKGGIITLGAETAKFFYQPYEELVVGNKMYSINHEKLTPRIAMYLISSFEKATKEIYGYNNGLTGSKFKEVRIILPVTSDGLPDWDYMEDYIADIEHKYVDNVRKFNQQENDLLKELHPGGESPGEPYEIKEFKVGNLFDMISIKQVPRGYNPSEHYGGKIPYITQTKDNNGITGFMVENSGLKLNDGGYIVLGVDNVANGAIYYQPNKFFANKVYGITHESMNNKAAMFIVTALKKFYMDKYSYSSKISKKIIEETQLLLPATINGSPDWEYMEKYISYIESRERERVELFLSAKKS